MAQQQGIRPVPELLRALSTSSPDESVELSVPHMLQRCHTAAAPPPLVQAQQLGTAAAVQIQNAHAAVACRGCRHCVQAQGQMDEQSGGSS